MDAIDRQCQKATNTALGHVLTRTMKQLGRNDLALATAPAMAKLDMASALLRELAPDDWAIPVLQTRLIRFVRPGVHVGDIDPVLDFFMVAARIDTMKRVDKFVGNYLQAALDAGMSKQELFTVNGDYQTAKAVPAAGLQANYIGHILRENDKEKQLASALAEGSPEKLTDLINRMLLQQVKETPALKKLYNRLPGKEPSFVQGHAR